MNYMRKAAAAAFTLVAAVAATAHAAPKLPVEAFAALPVVSTIELSPDGQKAALMVNNDGTTSILVQEVGKSGSKKTAIMSTDNKQYSFKWFQWVSNERLLVATRFPSKRRSVNSNTTVGGTDTYETRLLSAKADGGGVINLLKPTSFKGDLQSQFQDDVIDFDVDGGKHVLLSLADQQGTSSTDGVYTLDRVVYSLDVETGVRTHVHGPRANFYAWMADRNHTVRLGVMQDKADVEIHVCDPDGKNWRKLWAFKASSTDSVNPIGFGKDPYQLYVLADNGGREALFTVDLRDPQLKRSLRLASDSGNIYGSLAYSKKTGDAIGIVGSGQSGETQANYWDAGFKELVSFIDQALPNRYNPIISMSADETRYIVRSGNERTPAEFYMGDDRANTMGLFALAYPKLAAKDLAARQTVSIKARDGAARTAFLFTPEGAVAKNLPTVLLLQGGPQYSTDGHMNLWAQFLANRGFAVLQFRPRGYFGYGDDVSDAVQWLTAQGTTDPKRVCVVGGEYGGYAALMAAAKTPDLFRCAVSYAGVSDLEEMMRVKGYYQYAREVTESRLGSQALESERLRANSPLTLAAQIKIPVLLVHGNQDRSVRFSQSVAMDAALTAAGAPHKFIKQEPGEHGMGVYQHRLDFFTELEGFLVQNLGGAR